MAIIFSSVDRHNYGDLLYPVVINKLLNKNDHSQEDIYAFFDTDGVGECGYNVKSISKYFSNETAFKEDIIIGGGDSLRVDKYLLAEHCFDIYNKKRKATFFQKINEKIFGKKSQIEAFIAKFMSYDAPGPFILNSESLNNIDRIFYCSCGVPFEFPDNIKESVAAAFNNASYIYLRDAQSKQKLINAGVTNEIHVAPDLICTLSDFYNKSDLSAIGLDVLHGFGLEKNKKYLCFQTNPSCQSSIDKIVDQLIKVKLEKGYEIVLLPLGYCHDDDVILKEINKRAGNQFIYADVYSIYHMISIIAASDLFIGTSMHGNITAFSYGIPHLVAPINADKMKGFLDTVNLSNYLLLDAWTEIFDKIEYIENLEEDYFLKKILDSKQEIYKVMRDIKSLLTDSNE